MLIGIEAKIAEIQRLLDVRDVKPALAMLLGILSAERATLTRAELSIMYHLWARCEHLNCNFRSALLKEMVSERLAFDPSETVTYGMQKNLKGLILAALGRIDQAIEEYMEAFAARRKAKQTDRLWGPLLNIGLSNFMKGNLLQALENVQAASGYAERFNSAFEVLTCRIAESRIDLLMGRFREMREIHGGFNLSTLTSSQQTELLNLEAMACVWQLRYREAIRKLSMSSKQHSAAGYRRGVAVCLEYLGLNEYFAGSYKKAKEYYQQVLDMPEPTASAVAQTLRMLTDVHIAEGHWHLAKQTAAKAEAAITKISERIELGALWRAYGHLHAHDDNRDEARAFFTKSIELLRQLGARYELALSHFDAGRAKVFTAYERAEHLRSARTLFVAMDVPKRVVQVDEAIKQLEADRHSGESRNPASATSPTAPTRLTLKSPFTPTIVAESESMKRILALADKVKDTALTILITGETGTGKDLLAEYIHKTSLRADKRLVPINCAAVPETLVEMELFGHCKGAYTNAIEDKIGLIKAADGGTLFLNEVGELPLAVQAKLLDVIERKRVRALGGMQEEEINVRIIAATNRNLEQDIRRNSFRSDLYHRLCQMPIHLPPLRERREDIVPLVALLLNRYGLRVNGASPELPAALNEQLIAYEWPGNVRELSAIIMRVATLLDENGNSDVVRLLKQQLGAQDAEGSERRRLFEALRRHDGNKSKVADELGLPRTTLNSQLKKYNL